MMAIYALGVLIGRSADNWLLLLVARSLQGVGLSILPIALGIINLTLPKEKIAIGQGFVATAARSGGLSSMTRLSLVPVTMLILFSYSRHLL